VITCQPGDRPPPGAYGTNINNAYAWATRFRLLHACLPILNALLRLRYVTAAWFWNARFLVSATACRSTACPISRFSITITSVTLPAYKCHGSMTGYYTCYRLLDGLVERLAYGYFAVAGLVHLPRCRLPPHQCTPTYRLVSPYWIFPILSRWSAKQFKHPYPTFCNTCHFR